MKSRFSFRLVLLAAIFLSGWARADKLVSVDIAGGLITVEAKSGLKTYRLKPFTEVKINGSVGKLETLKPGMEVTVSLADGTSAARITAVGNALPGGVVPKPQPGVGTRRVTVKIVVDGTELIKIKDGKMWIEHKAWQKPEAAEVNGIPWEPIWKGNRSDDFVAFQPPLASLADTTAVVKRVRGRGAIAIAEPATAKNDYTLTLKIDDGAAGGADRYEFRLTW